MAKYSNLKFREDGTFTIVQIADLHYAGGTAEDEVTMAVMKSILKQERPDLVVFTGDAVKGNSCPHQLEQLLELLALPERLALPYAFVFGNHDSEHDICTREEMMEAIASRELCLAEAGAEHVTGVGKLRADSRRDERCRRAGGAVLFRHRLQRSEAYYKKLRLA